MKKKSVETSEEYKSVLCFDHPDIARGLLMSGRLSADFGIIGRCIDNFRAIIYQERFLKDILTDQHLPPITTNPWPSIALCDLDLFLDLIQK